MDACVACCALSGAPGHECRHDVYSDHRVLFDIQALHPTPHLPSYDLTMNKGLKTYCNSSSLLGVCFQENTTSLGSKCVQTSLTIPDGT